MQVTTVLQASCFKAQVPSGQETLLSPQLWNSGHSDVLALQELSKHFTGKCGGQVDIVEQDWNSVPQVPSWHLYGNSLGQLSNWLERHSSTLSTQAPFQHFILSFPQKTWVGHNSIELTQVPSKHL